MTIRSLRCTLRAGCVSLILLCASCDVFNPALVNQAGGSTANAGPEPTGSILIGFNNQRGIPLILNYTVTQTPPGGQTFTDPYQFFHDSTGVKAISHDCTTSSITITGISVGTATQPAQNQISLPLSITFDRPPLQCGSVIFVNVPLLGPPTAELFP